MKVACIYGMQQKLELYGIKGQALSLLKSYLTNRSQKWQINGFISSERFIRCGVPQGSILKPLLLLLYINDLPQCLNNTKPRLFATSFPGFCARSPREYKNNFNAYDHTFLLLVCCYKILQFSVFL
jgi:hypothetical protein